jgi:hypothetical protein
LCYTLLIDQYNINNDVFLKHGAIRLLNQI